MIKKVSKFFADIHGGDPVNFRCMKDESIINVNGLYNEQTIRRLNELNAQGYECYFVVNQGGYSSAQISRVNAVFIDLDCGRDSTGNYFSLDTVSDYKSKKLIELSQFALPSTYVNETRNGLQVLWLLQDGATVSEFGECEERLIAYFNADKHVKSMSQLLRVPGTEWCKYPTQRYMTQIVKHDDVRYNIQDIIDALPEAQETVSTGNRNGDRKNGFKLLSTPVTNTHGTAHTEFVMTQQADVLQALLKPEPYVAKTHKDVFSYVKHQDLREYLGVASGTFNCILHDDDNPSASIYMDRKSGDYMYKCHSPECGFCGSIIEVTQRLMGTRDLGKVMRFLRTVYRIEYAETEWQRQQWEILDDNLAFLESEKFRYGYPLVYQRISRYLNELRALHELARQHLRTEYFTDSRGCPVFFAGIGHIGRVVGKGEHQSKQVTNVVALLTYIGLINKLDVNDIPERMLSSARHHAAIKKQKNLVSFYSIPSYNVKTLNFANQKAIEYLDKGFTMQGWSYELLERSLGKEEANRVYPQLKDKRPSRLSVEVSKQLERIALSLIKSKGWTTYSEILSEVILFFSGQQGFKEHKLKAIIPEFLDKYGFMRIKTTKRLKEQLGIQCKGYPYVIVPDSEVWNKTDYAVVWRPSRNDMVIIQCLE